MMRLSVRLASHSHRGDCFHCQSSACVLESLRLCCKLYQIIHLSPFICTMPSNKVTWNPTLKKGIVLLLAPPESSTTSRLSRLTSLVPQFLYQMDRVLDITYLDLETPMYIFAIPPGCPIFGRYSANVALSINQSTNHIKGML